MPPRPLLTAGLLTVCLTLSLAAGWSIQSRADPDPVYSVAQVNRHLADNPRAWSGRRVHVRGIGGGCIPWAAPKDSPCIDEGSELVEMRAGNLVAALTLTCGQDPPLPRFVRELPWLGRLLPVPQVLIPSKLAVYRVQLPPTPGYDVLLLDSLPSCGDEEAVGRAPATRVRGSSIPHHHTTAQGRGPQLWGKCRGQRISTERRWS